MPLLDLRLPAVNLHYRAGNSVTLTLTWTPTGTLTGRTFQATLDAAALTLTVAGDVMTITASEAQTAAAVAVGTFTLTETTGGIDQELITGTWSASDLPSATSNTSVTVTESAGSIAVTVVGTDAALHIPFAYISPGWPQRVRSLLGEAATRRVWVQAWGGSVTIGSPGASDPRTTSWAALLRDALCTEYGNGGTGYINASLATMTGSWSLQAWPGFAAAEFRASAAATLTWANLAGTTIRIFHRNVGITGSFRYRIDGGDWTVVTPPTGFGGDPGSTEVTGLADTAHTVEVEWVSGTVGINGVEASRSTGIVFQLCATGGRGFSDYDAQAIRRADIGITNTSTTITSTAPGHFTSSDVNRYLATISGGAGIPADAQITAVASAISATISAAATATGTRTVDFCTDRPSDETWPAITWGNAFAPGLSRVGQVDLVICEYGINDGGTTVLPNLERSARGVSRVIGPGFEAAREVVMLAGHHGAFSGGGGPSAIRGMGAAIARATSGAFVDIWGRGRRSFTYWDGLGYFADQIHPSDAGHAQYAAALVELLT